MEISNNPIYRPRYYSDSEIGNQIKEIFDQLVVEQAIVTEKYKLTEERKNVPVLDRCMGEHRKLTKKAFEKIEKIKEKYNVRMFTQVEDKGIHIIIRPKDYVFIYYAQTDIEKEAKIIYDEFESERVALMKKYEYDFNNEQYKIQLKKLGDELKKKLYVIEEKYNVSIGVLIVDEGAKIIAKSNT